MDNLCKRVVTFYFSDYFTLRFGFRKMDAFFHISQSVNLST